MNALPGRVVVFDSEGLSRAVRRDPVIQGVVAEAIAARAPVVVSAVTLVEGVNPGLRVSALEWVASRLRIEPVTDAIARTAVHLLAAARLHGHRHALDAIVAATALSLPGRALIFTSDPGDFRVLVGTAATVVPL